MKVLALDIETRPHLAHVWSLWDENVGLDQLVSTTEVICFGAKWVEPDPDAVRTTLGRRGVYFASTFHDGREVMLQNAWYLLDEADVVMHWNGRRFDIPHLNREFIQAGFGPPSPYRQLDLMETAKRQFKFASNKLQHVSTALGLQGKHETGGFKLWLRCMDGDDKAWRLMRKYNIQDVELLEQIYEVLQAWIPNHPNRRLYDGSGCPRCGGTDLQKRGFAHTSVGRYQQYQCQGCGGYFRAGKRLDGVDLRPVA